MRGIATSLGALAFVIAGGASVQAGDPFLLTAQTTSGTPETVSASGSNLPNLLTHLIKEESEFSSLSNRDVSGSLRYAGLNNAILVTKSADNSTAVVTIPSINFTKTFNSTNGDSLNTQIRKFAEKNGATIYGDFIRSINQSTDVGVTDGNPLASTAIFANQAYTQFGIQPEPFSANHGAINPIDLVATPNIRLDLNGGYSHSDTASSYFAGGSIALGAKLGDRVGLVFTTPFEYRNVEGGAVYNIAEEISLPILILKPKGNANVSWLVTPTGIVGGGGSVDLASGGLLAGGQVTSSLSLQCAGFVFTLADSFAYMHGFPVTVGAYKFETNLDQEILKNGVKVSKFFGDAFFLDAGITYTNFLLHSAINEYWTPSAGLGCRLGQNAGVRVAYNGDFGHDFVVHGGSIQLYLNY